MRLFILLWEPILLMALPGWILVGGRAFGMFVFQEERVESVALVDDGSVILVV